MSENPEWDRVSKRLFALLREAGVPTKDREMRLRLYRWFFHDPTISSTNDLSADAMRQLANTLTYWQNEGRLQSEVMRYAAPSEEQ